MNTDMHIYFLILEYVLLFLDDNMNEEYEYYQKFNLRVLSICFIFCQFQLGIAYKPVAYKKRFILIN